MSAFWGLFMANQKRILDFTTMPVQRAADADDIMQEYFVNIGFYKLRLNNLICF